MSFAENNISDDTAAEKSYSLNADLVHFITEALDNADQARVMDHIAGMHSADIAELLGLLRPDQRRTLIEYMRDKFDPEILVDLEPHIKDQIIECLGVKESARHIIQLDSDDAIQVIEDLHEDGQQEILDAISNKEQRAELEEGLAYGEDSAGRLMNKSFVAIPDDWHVGKAIDFLRQENDLPSDFHNIFIVDKKQMPVGSVMVSRVIRSKRDVPVREIMDPDLKTIEIDTDQEDVGYMFRKYALASAPVLDDDRKMVGVVSVDDVVDVIDEEAEEDIMRMGGVQRGDLHSHFWDTAIKRFPWLFVNLLTAIAASVVISLFEGAIEKLVALAVLMPIVASMGGNAGTQTLTIAVRSIATKDLTATNALRVINKEIIAALVNGLFFAFIVSIASYIIYQDQYLSLIFAVATLVTLVIAGFAGAFIPLLLARMGLDPAISSVVFLTTVTDISAFFIFLGLATWMMP